MADYVLPERLVSMVADGVWDTPGYVDDRVDRSIVEPWDPVADGIHLTSSFETVSELLASLPELPTIWPTDGVDPDRLVVIADFGLGTDNPVVLDFSVDPPAVLTIDFDESSTTPSRPRWKTIASSFDGFVDALGLS